MKVYIYKIKRKNYEFENYIGQTIKNLEDRLKGHFWDDKSNNVEFKEWLKNYKRDIEIIPIEEFEYENIQDVEKILNKRERFWVNFYKNNTDYKCFTKFAGNTGRSINGKKPIEVNGKKPIEVNGIKYESRADYHRKTGHYYKIYNSEYEKRQKKEYYKTHKNEMKNKYSKYYINNKDKIKERSKIYVNKNKERIKKYKKAYYESNKYEILEKRKEYAKKNKNKIKEYVKSYRIIYENKNRDRIRERKRKYYQDRKNKI